MRGSARSPSSKRIRRLGASTAAASPPTSAPRSRARSGSTPAAAPSTRPTPRTTGCRRSASSSRATWTSSSRSTVSAASTDAPIVLRGGGTSLAGQGCNTAVLIDFSKYLHHILELDPDRRVARVQPGCVLDDLRGAASEKHGLTFGPDPSTHAYCTLGGMLGNNSCGRHSVQAEFHGPGPRVADNVVELEVLTYRGERLRIGRGGDGVPGRDRRAAARARRRERRRDPRALSADPAPRLGLQPRRAAAGERLRGRALARRHRVDVRDDPRGDARADPAPAAASRSSSSATRTSSAPATTSRSRASTGRSRSRGWTTR